MASLERANRPPSIPLPDTRPPDQSPAAPPTSPPLRSPTMSPLADDSIERVFDSWIGPAKRKSYRNSVLVKEVPHGSSLDDAEKHPVDEFPPYVYEWPSNPLELSAIPEFYFVLLDLALAAAPLLPIVYAIMAIVLDHSPTAANYFENSYTWSGMLFGPAMMEAQKWAPTIFLMIFGIAIARLVKAFALYRIERGTRIGFVEQLVGSQSLSGTIASIWGLRVLNLLGLGLLTIWALGPVGSQASARIISNNGTLTQLDQISYMSTNATPNGLVAGNADLKYYKYAVDSMFATSILTPSAMSSPQDVWANVKIPSLEWLERNNGCGSDGWCSWDLAKANSTDPEAFEITAGTFSSLTGLPVVGGIYGLGVQSFSVESNYYAFDCPTLESTDPTVQFSSAIPGRDPYNTEPDSAIWTSGSPANPYTFFLDTDTPLAGPNDTAGNARLANPDLLPRNLTFGSRANNATTIIARCTMSLTHIQSDILCNFTNPLWTTDLDSSGLSATGACRVMRSRRSLVDRRPENLTPFDTDFTIAQRFFTAFPGATGLIPAGTSSPTERFIASVSNDSAENIFTTGSSRSRVQPLVATNWLGYAPTTLAVTTAAGANATSYVDLIDLTPLEFTERFALLFNTYWHSFCNLQALTETEISLAFSATMPTTVMFNTTQVTMILPGQFYAISVPYLVVFLVCSLVALFAGIAATVLKYHTLVPDVLGSVSTMTRDNPHTIVPPGGSALDGPDFARYISNMPVKFVDLDPTNPYAGRIGLSTLGHGEDVDYGQVDNSLKKGRLYR